MHVLIVEDDQALGHFLEQALRAEGHEVVLIADGETAVEYVASRRPDAMVLDLGLPRKDGLEVLAEVCERFGSTSVLVLTGRSGLDETVRCLDLGADDVVLKPFSLHELCARLKAVLRRQRRYEAAVLRFGDLEMDRVERTVRQAGREVELTPTEFLLLESLMQRRGEQVCSRRELLREVWREPREGAGGPETGVHTNVVEVYVNYLRKKLGGAGTRNGASVIRTVRGAGYLLGVAGQEAKRPRRRKSAAVALGLGGCVAGA